MRLPPVMLKRTFTVESFVFIIIFLYADVLLYVYYEQRVSMYYKTYVCVCVCIVMTQFSPPLTASETLLKLTINLMGFQPSMVSMNVLVGAILLVI